MLARLDAAPFLLVLDDLERILIAYHRMDASYLADDEYDQQTANAVAGGANLPACQPAGLPACRPPRPSPSSASTACARPPIPGPGPFSSASPGSGPRASNALADMARAEGNEVAAAEAATKAYKAAWCDGPPYAYHWGLAQAKGHLDALGVPEPELPPFDDSRFDPLPEVEINPRDGNRVDPAALD